MLYIFNINLIYIKIIIYTQVWYYNKNKTMQDIVGSVILLDDKSIIV